MKYRHNITGRIFDSEEELRRAYPNTSFPMHLDSHALEYANVQEVVETTQPQTTIFQRAEYTGVSLIDDKWTDTWTVLPLYDDPEQQLIHENECIGIQWGFVREERDRVLKETDYIVLLDSPVSQDCQNKFIAYRTELRNITQTQTDPYNIIWPIAPAYEKKI